MGRSGRRVLGDARRSVARRVALAACFCALVASVAEGANPPYSGTVFIRTDIITTADWSAYQSMTYEGLSTRTVFDRRVNNWVRQPMHLFDAVFADGLDAEVQVNPEFGDATAALATAEQYVRAVGRLPTALRVDVDSITFHAGVQPFGGGNRNILIHTGQAVSYGGYLEEALFHEATHTSFDADHAASAGWLAAQAADPTFISTYARDNPTREDVAESLLPWYALRHTNVLFPFQAQTITNTMPNRIAYFDGLDFQLNEPPLPSGDFNGDGTVDAADYTVWRDTLSVQGIPAYSQGDANGDGSVTAADYAIWKNQFGGAPPGRGAGDFAAVPEPSSLAWVALGGAMFLTSRSRKCA
jgi:hypothetical protein